MAGPRPGARAGPAAPADPARLQAIALLERGEGELQAELPAAPAGGGAGAEGAEARLRQLMRDVEALKGERDALEGELQATSLDLRDQFLAALAADGALDEPAISCAALGQALAPLQRRVAASLQRQEDIVAQVQVRILRRVGNTRFCDIPFVFQITIV